ncbi:MAG: L,D-transpeptidase family protein [Streptosporangiales bacterium]|nr:L,D-transpeptidase family protein [Streptosporangiales bacterium]MBO0891134.1 L,D-transpeptidase family protein [Acidothermales bacterium]
MSVRRLIATASALSVVMVLATAVGYAPGSSGGSASAARQAAATRSATPTPPPKATIAITPGDKSRSVRPDRHVVVRAANGRLTGVSVTSKDGRDLTGTYSSDHTTWTSQWTMRPSAKYRATASAENRDNVPTRARSTFRTLSPAETFSASMSWIAPSGATVGVGFPLVVDFSSPVHFKAAVERALEVKMSTPVEGAWHWTSDDEVVFRPRAYWPAHEKIRVLGHFTGIRAAKGVYGDENLTAAYAVGEQVIVKASAKTHQLSVYQNGKRINHWPVSMGRGGEWKYFTTSGIHVTMSKSSPERMVSPGIKKGEPGYYDELIYWAVRISNSGEFVHSMPSTVWAQGNSNVSHGCINSPPDKAEWFYDFEHPGDVVVVTGTPRKLEADNGWGFWQASWNSWLAGSATGEPVNR